MTSDCVLTLALVLVAGWSCHRRLPKAELEEGCRDKLPNRCNQLANEFLAENAGKAALPWYSRACELGHRGSCLREAEILEWGWGVDAGRPRARELYETSCRMGVTQACAALALFDELEATTVCQPVGEVGPFVERLKRARDLQYESLGYCYQLVRESVPPIDVHVEVLLGTDGRVHDSRTVVNSRPDLATGECMREQLMKWRFPCPPEAGRFVIKLAFKPDAK